MDLTSLSPLPANSIDRDEPHLELETHIGIDSVIAVRDAISSAKDDPSPTSSKIEGNESITESTTASTGRTKRQPA